MGNISLLKKYHIFRRKTETQGINIATQMLILVGSAHRGNNLRFGQNLGQSHLHHRYLIAFG